LDKAFMRPSPTKLEMHGRPRPTPRFDRMAWPGSWPPPRLELLRSLDLLETPAGERSSSASDAYSRASVGLRQGHVDLAIQRYRLQRKSSLRRWRNRSSAVEQVSSFRASGQRTRKPAHVDHRLDQVGLFIVLILFKVSSAQFATTFSPRGVRFLTRSTMSFPEIVAVFLPPAVPINGLVASGLVSTEVSSFTIIALRK
jgi:hypothetical protein